MTAPHERPLIYIAGPYSKPDPVENTHRAIKAGDAVWAAGGCPVIPHLSMLWHAVSPAPYGTWLERDLGLLHRCDGLLRLPGESAGADGEVEFARLHCREFFTWAVMEPDDDVAATAAELVASLRGMAWDAS